MTVPVVLLTPLNEYGVREIGNRKKKGRIQKHSPVSVPSLVSLLEVLEMEILYDCFCLGREF